MAEELQGQTIEFSQDAADTRRLRHSTLGISLGRGGAGSAWSLAHLHFGAPAFIAEILFAASTLWWAMVTGARAPISGSRLAHLRKDFRSPTDGPLVAYIPVIGLLLISHYGPHLHKSLLSILSIAFTALLALVCARLLAFLTQRGGAIRTNSSWIRLAGYCWPIYRQHDARFSGV